MRIIDKAIPRSNPKQKKMRKWILLL